MMNPEDVFRRAQFAVQNKDWHTFFACLDQKELIETDYFEPMEFVRKKGNWYIRLIVGKRSKERFKHICGG